MTAQWQAQWIWVHEDEQHHNTFVEARRTFQLQSQAARAVVRVTANQFYILRINGQLIGRGPAPSDSRWKYYDEYEPAAALQTGDNVIAVTAYNFGTEPIVTDQMQGPGGLLVQLDISGSADKANGLTIASDSSWKCRRSPRWVQDTSRQHNWRGFREIYLAEKEDGWEEPGYDDSLWPDAVSIAEAEQADSPWPRLIARDIPHLQQTVRLPLAVVACEGYLGQAAGAAELLDSLKEPRLPQAGLKGAGMKDVRGEGREGEEGGELLIDASVPGSYPQVTYDFGREAVGYPQLVVDAPEGGVVQLFYGESLDMALTDTFMLKKGRNELAPFHRRAFRYMKLAVQATPRPIRIRQLQVQHVHYPFPSQGSFSCSDELLERIWETGQYTTLVNTQDHFEDCPHREQALWVADAVVMAKVVYQAFGDAAIVRKSLLQSARIQREDGSIPGTGPETNHFILPDFCAHWLFGVHEYWRYSSDRAFLEKVWPNVRRLLEWFAAQEDEHGLFSNADRPGWWCFIDWTNDIERKDRVTAISCFYYKALLLTSELALELEEHELAAGYMEKAKRLRESVRVHLRPASHELFADCLTEQGLSNSVTAQTNFAAAWTGIMTEEEAKRFIADIYLQGKLPRIRGAFFYHIVLETLFRCGFADAALEQIRYYWGSMLERGATTWWETFDPDLPFCTIPSPYQGNTPTYLRDEVPVSLCHGWGASPTNLLLSDILGVDVRELGTGCTDKKADSANSFAAAGEGSPAMAVSAETACTAATNSPPAGAASCPGGAPQASVVLRPQAAGGLAWAKGVVPTRYGDIAAEWKKSDEENGCFDFTAVVPEGFVWKAEGLQEIAVQQLPGQLQISGRFRSQQP